MRYRACIERGTTRLQISIEASTDEEASRAAEVFAANRPGRGPWAVTGLGRDYAIVVNADGEVRVLTDIFDGTYERLERQ